MFSNSARLKGTVMTLPAWEQVMFVCQISFRLLALHLHALEISELALLGRRHALLVSGKETAVHVMTLTGLFDQVRRK